MDINDDNNSSSDNTGSSFEAGIFLSSPFLRNLGAFVRHEEGDNTATLRTGAVPWEKPAALSSLSPGVLARLRFLDDAVAEAARIGESTGGNEERRSFLGEDGRIEWSRVRIPPDHDDGEEREEETLAEGAQLAVACHTALRRQTHDRYQQQQRKHPVSPPRLPQEGVRLWPDELAGIRLPFAEALPGVIERIVGAEIDDEQVYLALCVCLIILERALYDIYRIARGRTEHHSSRTQVGERISQANGKAEGADEGCHDSGAAPIMILRDLIATPEIKAALPEQMVAVLRILLLPKGFNIRNLVWHGFLAPRELPRELASLVLMVTLCIPAVPKPPGADMTSVKPAYEDREPQQAPRPSPPLPPLSLPTQSQPEPLQTDRSQRTSWWVLDSFDDRLTVPPALILAVDSLLSDQHQGELDALVRRSAFVLPGREDMSVLALRALGGGRGPEKGREVAAAAATTAFFLVAMLPVLEHGLRCLFSCANDSPGHLFAHLRRYYSTLDGFGQKARHQLLLDQEISGFPGRSNLLLAALGPGVSAVLLDLFMMSAGPNLRGKVAHGEMDMSFVFLSSTQCFRNGSRTPLPTLPSGTSGGESAEEVERRSTRMPAADIVKLTAAVFLVLCGRYEHQDGQMPGEARAEDSGAYDCGSTEHDSGSEPDHEGRSSSLSSPGAFADALDACERYCSGWVPRFHPHELLEADLRASRDEFDSLALALKRRVVTVEVLPGGELARMSVAMSGDGTGVDRCSELHEKDVDVDRLATSPPGTQVSQGNEDGRQRQEHGTGELVQPPCAEKGEDHGGMVLSLIDTTSRLVPPALSVNKVVDEENGPYRTSPTHDGSSGVKASKNKNKHDAGTNAVFSNLLRVERALQSHAAGLSRRFTRSSSSSARDAAVGQAPRPPSAFASHYHKPSNLLHPAAGTTDTTSNDPCNEACASDTTSCAGEPRPSPGVSTGPSCHSNHHQPIREPADTSDRRISPKTNVITAVPLPAVARMSGLCGACAGVARGLRERIGELEALLSAGSARSGQRRAYAATIQVAPTLLRFLTLSVAAVELFVVEWDRRHHEGVGGGPGGRTVEWSLSSSSSSCSPAAPGEDDGDVSADLTFLARLAAVNGALGLCVAARAEAVPRSTTTATTTTTGCSSSSGSEENRSKADAFKKNGGAGKKGFAQALSELASFLETRAARQGFGGR